MKVAVVVAKAPYLGTFTVLRNAISREFSTYLYLYCSLLLNMWRVDNLYYWFHLTHDHYMYFYEDTCMR